MSNILVVDDEAIITMQLEERLIAMGYSVVGMAASGEEAIEKARIYKPDLVLMDIVMPGKIDGIEAAKTITEVQDIPVVFVTSYVDDQIIEKAKAVKPYGYIVKPFNGFEIKAAIEVALFRKHAEKKDADGRGKGDTTTGDSEAETLSYLDLPEFKTVLLKDLFTGIMMFLYTDQVDKEPIFKVALEGALEKGGRNLYSYSQSRVQKYFLKEIQKEELFTYRLKKGAVYTLSRVLEKCIDSLRYDKNQVPLHLLIDFSDTEEFEDILAIKNLIISKKDNGAPVSGIIAINIGNSDHHHISSFAEGISKVIVSTGKTTTLSFAHHTFPAESISVVPQETIDDVIKKLLEPVILSLLEKPISGYDIIHEIHSRYNVLIPQARVYNFLYDLESQGYLEIKISGKSKLYSPTATGKKYISRKLNEFKLVFKHILSDRPEELPGIAEKGMNN
jgi:two-component system, response regulator PdtaR